VRPLVLRFQITFLWEVSPFQLTGGGIGEIESSGVDYILPYWLGRYYGVVGNNAVTSSASGSEWQPARWLPFTVRIWRQRPRKP
jgi:hypothetical protein